MVNAKCTLPKAKTPVARMQLDGAFERTADGSIRFWAIALLL